MIKYPNIVSRTLDPSKRSLYHVTALHDHELSDADLNLIQQLAEWKRQRLIENQTVSGCLSYSPFVFNIAAALQFQVPAFDVLFNGDVVTIGGNGTADLTRNIVTLPAPGFYALGSAAPQAAIYVVFIEFWYQRLNVPTPSSSGNGYAVLPSTGGLGYYPLGCVNGDPSNYIANDTIDPFMGSTNSVSDAITTERIQVQWAIRVQSVDLSYDFTTLDFGMDAGSIPTEAIYGQAGQNAVASGAAFQFTKMGPINGDTGLWRSGDGVANTGQLGTMDGYSYAMPLAVVFQRNTGAFVIDQNPLGSATPSNPDSGLLATNLSGRYDARFADVIYPQDVVDTRSTVTVGSGADQAILMRRSFVDLISGNTQAIGRGESPGNLPIALGSQLDYVVSVASTNIANTDTVGAFDGFMNGFSSATATYFTTKSISVNNKSVGQVGRRWIAGDAVSLTLPADSGAIVQHVQVQGLVDDTTNSTRTPVLFLSGQIQVTGIGTAAVTVMFSKDLTGTTYDPGMNPLYLTIGVQYPAGSGMDLKKVPSAVHGGELIDATSGKTLPLYGVSAYDVQTSLPVVGSVISAVAINPQYSDIIFGTRVTVPVSASSGVSSVNSSGNTITTFVMARTNLNGLTGIYVVAANDAVTGTALPIASRSINADNFAFQINGAVSSDFNVTFLIADTAQLAFAAPVKGVTTIEETVLAGTVSTDATLVMDSRVSVVSIKNFANDHNQVVLATTEAGLTGIAGDDVNKLIWVLDNQGNYNAVQVASAVFSNGFVTLTCPATVNLETQPFFVVAAILPAFATASQLIVAETYIPYQGEGHANRDYEVVLTEEAALVTTNGTGAAPVPGLNDIYPYSRELPIATMLPSQPTWSDATLSNTPVASYFDSNYVAKRNSNIEHTLEVPVHTNDFIEPIHLDKRKSFQLTTSGGGRGFSKAVPHLGFAIQPVTSRTVLGSTLSATISAVTIYVDNVVGNDSNDGLTASTPVKSIVAALGILPPVLRHPCTIQLANTGQSYQVSASTPLQTVALGDGDIRAIKYYALGCISFVVQQAGRLVITRDPSVSSYVAIDATGFSGFGDGPTSAFFIDNSRVIFNGINFIGFLDPAIKGIDADIEFVDCQFSSNVTAGSFEQGSSVIIDRGLISIANGTGFILSQSDLEASQLVFQVANGANPNALFVAERGSALTLINHSPTDETNVTASILVAEAQLNSSISCDGTFSTAGYALLEKNSVLSRTVALNPFIGGTTADSSSTTSTDL